MYGRWVHNNKPMREAVYLYEIAGELFVMCRRCGYRIAQCKHSSMVVQDSLSSKLLIDNEMDSFRALPERSLE